MALVLKDRVKVSTPTTGTGTLTLGSAAPGFQPFSVIGDGNTTYYVIVDLLTGDWEVGLGTYNTSGNTLNRNTVYDSSSSGAKVSFGAGDKIVFATYPAGWFTGLAPKADPTFTGTATVNKLAGADESATRLMFADCGLVFYDSGATSALDYTKGSHQRWAPTSDATLSITNWPPSGNLGELLIEGVDLGAVTLTLPTIHWQLSAGGESTTFGDTEVELQTSGTDWILLWTRDAGTKISGKVMR